MARGACLPLPDVFEAGRRATRDTVVGLLRTVADGIEVGSVALVSEDGRVELEWELSWLAGDEHDAAPAALLGPPARRKTCR